MGIAGNPDIVQNGLVLCLDAADRLSYPGTGTTWYDMSGNEYNATLYNGPTFNSTNGGSFYFDKTDDYARVTGANINAGSFSYQEITCNLWYKPGNSNTTNAAGNNIITVETAFEISVGDNLNGYSSLYYASNPWAWYGTTANVLTNNVWNMITFVNAYTGRWLYVNGVEVFYRGDVGYIQNGSASYPYMTLMARYDGSYSLNNGNLASVQLYNKVLSITEILQNYNSMKSRFGLK